MARSLEPEAGNPGPNVDGWCYRTLRHKTHSTTPGDEVVVLYGWHPWAGRLVRLHEVIERATGASARCSLMDTAVVRVQEIPVWMLDAAVCGTARATAQPVALLSALVALRALLTDASEHARRGASEGPTVASPESRGDRHATLSSPAQRTAPSTRSLSGKPAGHAGHPAGVERLAGTDATDADGTSDPPAHRTRGPCRSGARPPSGSRHR